MDYGEEERRRLARELHDDISQRLALLADDADRLRREVNWTDDVNRSRLDDIVLQARALSEDLRRISHNLYPAILEDLGLINALRSLTNDFAERTDLPISFVGSDLPSSLPQETSTALYRIVQEALRNIAKHAGETSVRVTLECQRGHLVLVISDLGTGFDPHHQTGLGLISMRERAHLAGGSFNINSSPSNGTSIQVSLPLPSSLAN